MRGVEDSMGRTRHTPVRKDVPVTAYIAALDATAGASSEAPAAPSPGRFRRMLGPIWGWKVPKRAAYVALQFPLGLAYFVAIAVVFSTGGALAWSIPGLALILLGVIASRWAGDIEAWLARRLVGTEIRRPPTWYEKDVPKREQAKQVLTDPSTWTGLVYLGSHLITGTVALVVFSVLSGRAGRYRSLVWLNRRSSARGRMARSSRVRGIYGHRLGEGDRRLLWLKA